MPEDEATIETDAALMNRLGDLLAEALPGADITFEGPIQESVLPPDVIEVAYVGTIAFFTIIGGLPGASDSLKAVANYISTAYAAANEKGLTLQPTTIKYRGKTQKLTATGDADAVQRLLEAVLQHED